MFGPTCNITCHCGVGGCDPDNGICDVTGCQSGWMGQSCFTECGPGTFGADCVHTCRCTTPGCNRETGHCTAPGCKEGWQGNACDAECGDGRFDQNCSQTCHCALPGCDRFNGSCTFAGSCPYKQFGEDCKKICHCAVLGCDRFSGPCTRPGCEAGWEGLSCDKACDVGKYGKDCKYTCNCATSECDANIGKCNVPGCDMGWEGSRCDIACNNTSFGSDCDHTCHCATPGCDRFTGFCNVEGCHVGWTGSACDTEAVQQPGDNQGASPLAGIIGGVCAAIAVIVIIIIITVILVRRKRQIPSKENDQIPRKPKKRILKIDRTNGDQAYVNMASSEAELGNNHTDQEEEVPGNVQDTHGDVHTDKHGDIPDVFAEDEEEVIYINNPSRTPVSADTKMKVTDLHNIIVRKNSNDTFDTEYQNLPHGLIHPHGISKAPENIIFNRFKTTFAYDHSRVTLRKEKEGYTDYINANYIEDTQGVKAYIATQGPKVTTIEDFWRMAWQNECGKIIMLANLVEVGKKKCANYWMGKDGDSLQLGLYQVTLLEEEAYAFYTIRKVSVKNKQTNAKRQISQYHFTRWSDHGVPEAFELLQFYKRVESCQTDLKGPLIVHCSAGIGRTGTYIGLDALLREGKLNDEIDVFGYTERMRNGRMNMIQTLEQYKVLHDVLAEGFGIVTYGLTGTDFSRNISKLIAGEIAERQFNVLERHRPTYGGKEVETALNKTNKRKNKDLSVLAVEKYRLYLPSTVSNYINAIKVPSYRDPHGYILTQHPLHNTVVDFWSMVSQQLVEVVVSIGSPQDCIPWPVEEGRVETFGDFTLKYEGKQNKAMVPDVLIQRKMILQDKRNATETAVTILETSSWNGGGTVPPTNSMLDMIQQVLSFRDSATSPIVITCLDGATDSGLLCVLCNVMERLKVDGDIDIIAAVRQLQIRRPQCLPNKAQYEYCYTVMKDHVETANVYANC
ncbi:receptor-type tyrosine-protein phosphatase epsilon-like [Pecten maximus]|uniref:receptor-type tyrosine-protein phosphatase epsilon-like n=1 Tax=Pecten maximus TaxID=6579 RepID=UPI0014588248|nr:receptor-type tyrosine-protein phosphatase epsilon-like [Pecten maximus]